MEVTQEIVLPVLLAAIVANAVILLLVVVTMRVNRRDGVTPSATRSALQGSLMSTSYVDRSARSTWATGGETDGPADTEAASDDAIPAHAHDDSIEVTETDAESAGTSRGGAASAVTGPDSGAGADDEPNDAAPTDADASSGIDPLTGLLDQAAFARLIASEDLRVHRYRRPVTIVIIELGGLDRLVDRLGPDAGDRVVPALADTMRRLGRQVDQVARLAPGRFGVLMPETDEVAAINYVERVRRACELWLESGAIALSLAAGWAGTDGDPTLLEAQRVATERMYVELRRDARRAGDR